MEINIKYTPNARQGEFHKCSADEAVYGGAKGGGKSCGLVMEGLAYGLENAGAEMYLFRETYDDLEANIIREWKEKVPKELYKYNEGKHTATLKNGTVMKFRYIRNFQDAEGYQGRSMDWIGVDELTKHEKRSIQILLSCLRSPKGFKPTFRGTCNPGGIGHTWVKEDYIEPTGYGKKIITDPVTGNKRAFIPAKVYDNDILMKNDPKYVRRLENLPEAERKAFLDGDWDIFTGQYFGEYKRDIHVVEPFVIPKHWIKYRSIDYGLDMLACLWFAVDPQENVYVYRELHEPDHIIASAAKRIKQLNLKDEIKYTYAPPDLWGRRQDTGLRASDTFNKNGVRLTKSKNNRVNGWYAVKDWIKVIDSKDEITGEEIKTSKLRIFSNCTYLIKYLPQIQRDEKNPNDCALQPHEVTHINDALRYFCSMKLRYPNTKKEKPLSEQKRDKMIKSLGGKLPNKLF
ncbi:terminase large subunit domain-containing protein [Anaerovorax sp. IOR16]|uniref:terminase large subunit domain-containing protein n=1 Tax=Anaerovorax sp. IOR16 TaxID=2773458 RepID=UPI0019D16234|nr:terminase family protein [Anaerovorax sp. IOR16]